jgi:hypothetical protein
LCTFDIFNFQLFSIVKRIKLDIGMIDIILAWISFNEFY